MLRRELLEILEEMSEEELEEEVVIASEIIGETTYVDYDRKTNIIMAYE